MSAEHDLRERPERATGQVVEAVALVERPLGIWLVPQEVAAVERERVLQALHREILVSARGRLEALRDRFVELVGVDADMAAIDRIAALDRDDERRAGPAGTVRLELLAQRVHEVADVAEALAPGTRPERLGDDVGRHHAVALADQVLEELPRPLL